jgi:hypothetical protein
LYDRTETYNVGLHAALDVGVESSGAVTISQNTKADNSVVYFVLLVLAAMLLTYIIGDHLVKLIRLFCDQVLGKIMETFINWLKPVTGFFERSQSTLGGRIDIFRALGSLFLFLITVGLAVVNYVLIYFGMELLVPGEVHLGALGFSGATLASIMFVLTELVLGFAILELAGITDLLGWHTWPSYQKWFVGVLASIFLLMVIAAEAGVSLYRIYQVGVEDVAKHQGLARFMSQMPYWVTFLAAVGVPVVTALSAFSLRDILLILGWLLTTIFLVVCKVLALLLDTLHSIITHIDDLLSAAISVFTYPVEVVVSFIVFVLVKLRAIRVLAVFLLFVLTSFACNGGSCNGRSKGSQEPTPTTRPRFVVVLMDNSASFTTYLNRALRNCQRYIDSLGNGDGFTLLLIDAESLKGNRPPFIETTWLPEAHTHIVPRNIRERTIAVKDNLKAKVDSLGRLPRARYTDLVGAIVRASNLLRQDTVRYARHLIIFSDMRDTRGREMLLGTTLSGVYVRLLFVDVTDQATQRNLETWKKTLLELGAREVLALNPDQSEGLKDYALPNH